MQSRLRLSGIINSAMDGIITINKEQSILVFNSAAERMFLCSADEAVGSRLDRFIPERFRANHLAHVQNFSKDGTSSRAMGRFGFISGLRKNGEEFPIEASISQIVLENQHLFTVTLRDASERKQAEMERLNLESQLRQSQKLEAIGTLAGGIAHDFNNILGIIVGNAEMLEADTVIEGKTRVHLERIQKASARATDLVQQILTFSRRKEPLRESFALDDAIHESLKLLRASIPSSVAILSLLNAPHAHILGDTTQIHQVVMNLVTNAWQAMLGHTGEIQILSVPEVHLRSLLVGDVSLQAGNYAHLTVRDNGQGIAAKDVHRVFDPFFTTKAPGEGTGLGLAVVHGIIRSTGGAISIKSEVGVGTEFNIYLPLYSGNPSRQFTEQPHLPTAGAGEHIVLVDDEIELINVTQEALEQFGFQISAFVDPRSALEYICSHGSNCAMLITDMSMPHMTGLELVRAIRKQEIYLPALLLTGLSDVVSKEDLQSLKIENVLTKPIKGKQLAQVISTIFKKGRSVS